MTFCNFGFLVTYLGCYVLGVLLMGFLSPLQAHYERQKVESKEKKEIETGQKVKVKERKEWKAESK